jgi:hypothetical protein
MQFNYDINGLNVDVGGALEAKSARELNQARQGQIEQQQKEKERIDRLMQQRNDMLASNPKANTANLDRNIAAIDARKLNDLRELDTKMNAEQQQSLFDTIYEAKVLNDNGMFNEAATTIAQRDAMLRMNGMDNRETGMLMEALNSGDKEKWGKSLELGMELGEIGGYITPPDPDELDFDSNNTFFDKNGEQYFNVFNKSDGTIRREYTGNNFETIDQFRDLPPLSKEANVLIKQGVDGSRASTQAAGTSARLATQVREQLPDSGLLGNSLSEDGFFAVAEGAFRGFLGEQTPKEFLRKNITKFQNTEIVNSLPAGIASDADIRLIAAGFPKAYDNPELLADWFDAYSRTAQAAAMRQSLEAQFIEQGRGMSVSKVNTIVDGVELKKGDTFRKFMLRRNKKVNAEIETAKKSEEARQNSNPNNDDDRSEDEILSQYGVS